MRRNATLELFDTDEPGWFADDAPIRRVHADASMFVGGLRALLLQSLHPLAMAGVAQHSDYRADPWGRLQRTADFLAATTFGPASQAQRAVDTVHRVHERVTGVAPDGRRYEANDPHLLEWVHIAELDSFLAAHDRYGEHPLIGDDRDRYVADAAVVARALGVIDPPESEAALRDRHHSIPIRVARHPRSERVSALPPVPTAAAVRRPTRVRADRRRRGGTDADVDQDATAPAVAPGDRDRRPAPRRRADHPHHPLGDPRPILNERHGLHGRVGTNGPDRRGGRSIPLATP